MKLKISPRCYTPKQIESIYKRLNDASGILKVRTGISVNAAFFMMQNAMDELRRHPKFRQEVKAAFNQAVRAYENYERAMRYGNTGKARFFDVKSFTPAHMREGVTSDEYFELWQSLGGAGYDMSIDEINVLKHKYYLILDGRGDKYPSAGANALTVLEMFRNAVGIYTDAIDDVCDMIPEIPKKGLADFFCALDVQSVAKAWEKAVRLMCGDMNHAHLTDFEKKNLDMAISSLSAKYKDSDWMFRVECSVVKYYPELVGGKCKANKLVRDMKMSYAEAEGGLR